MTKMILTSVYLILPKFNQVKKFYCSDSHKMTKRGRFKIQNVYLTRTYILIT